MMGLIGLGEVLRAGWSALLDPASDPMAAVFSLAILVLVLLVVVLAVMLVVSYREAAGRSAGVLEDEAARTRPTKHRASRPAWLRWAGLVALLVVVALLGYGWTYSTSDAACAGCHFTEQAVESHAEGSHADVPCRRCHVGPGAARSILARIEGAGNAMAYLTGTADIGPASARVVNEACVSCHEDAIREVTLARGIRMRHEDVLGIGHACIDCHNTEGHGVAVRRAVYPRMSLCISCHDDERETATCATCHSEDIGVAVRRMQRPYAQTNVAREDCRGCHSIESCNACHGLELPHSEQFMEGFHARKALLEPDVCARCHTLRFCNECHRFTPSTTSQTSWDLKHGNMGSFRAWHSTVGDVGLGSCSCHDTDRERFCNYCHGPQPER
ncbi:MAG: hypothetical protein JXR33_01605 [Coriobacteriia bacterium]|nr:hypothetical protein [Coriobacteriia bacterium]